MRLLWFLSHFPVFLPSFHFLLLRQDHTCFIIHLFIKSNSETNHIGKKTSWIMLLIMIFLGSHALKILFIHMYIHTARILSPSQGKAKSLKMFKPFVQAFVRAALCFPTLQQDDFNANLSVNTKGPHFIIVAATVPCSLASRRKF